MISESIINLSVFILYYVSFRDNSTNKNAWFLITDFFYNGLGVDSIDTNNSLPLRSPKLQKIISCFLND